jgi:hypothetical protein
MVGSMASPWDWGRLVHLPDASDEGCVNVGGLAAIVRLLTRRKWAIVTPEFVSH